MADFGIKISAEGKDVKSLVAGSLDLLLDSEAKSLKLKVEGDGSQGDTISHGGSSIPIYLVYDSDTNVSVEKRRISLDSYATSSNIILGGGQYSELHYFIFYDE